MKCLTLSLLLAFAPSVMAQTTLEKFESYRQNVLSNFQSYRNATLNRYADFLDTVWKDLESQRPMQRMQRPKPKQSPKTTPLPSAPTPTPLPQPTMSPVAQPTTPTAPTLPTVPTPSVPSTPSLPPSRPTSPTVTEPERVPQVTFNFYDMEISLPRLELPLSELNELGNGTALKALNRTDFEEKALPVLKQQVGQMQLPDYFVLELVAHYARALMPTASATARTNFMHFVLLLSGYDVRPAFEVESSTPVLLIPFKQQVYARSYLQESQNYYIFTSDLEKLSSNESMRFRTPSFDASSFSQLHPLDLVIHQPLRVKGKSHTFALQQGGINVSGQVNETLMKMVLHYPQMPVPCYAQSVLNAEVRRQVEQQIKAQIGQEGTLQNANKLLHFVQSAFEYATDDEQFGFEKPFFFEELLYYPQCDCEDRAVFYATLLRRVMGVSNHLIQFPGHECVAISLPKENPSGTYYESDNQRYYISDPTYIGANTGQCMPQYQNTAPLVQKW